MPPMRFVSEQWLCRVLTSEMFELGSKFSQLGVTWSFQLTGPVLMTLGWQPRSIGDIVGGPRIRHSVVHNRDPFSADIWYIPGLR
jgi:hypothetical protein